MWGESVFNDLVEDELMPDGSVKFKHVVSASTMNTVSCVLNHPQRCTGPQHFLTEE